MQKSGRILVKLGEVPRVFCDEVSALLAALACGQLHAGAAGAWLRSAEPNAARGAILALAAFAGESQKEDFLHSTVVC